MIEPTLSRTTICEDGDALKITIPSGRQWFATYFSSFGFLIMSVMSFGELFEIILHENTTETWINILFLIISSVGTVVLGYTLIWRLAGREILTVGPDLMALRRYPTLFWRTKVFRADKVRGLRATFFFLVFSPWQEIKFSDLWGINIGPIAFDYGAKTYRFGAGIDEAEAKQIVSLIKSRFPALGEAHL